ncbi:MAG: Bax inhibitor-1/YccA family protein [Chlamydiota bacterium]|nr:Bax inhibitor-1/YccA family protein [Chlamydiota bacterium]
MAKIQLNERASYPGIRQRIVTLLLITLFSGWMVWVAYSDDSIKEQATPIMLTGLVIGMLFGIITSVKKRWAYYTTISFAFFEGIFCGSYSYFLDVKYPGIALQAIGIVFTLMLLMLWKFLRGSLKMTSAFKKYVGYGATLIFLTYLTSMLLGFYGVTVPLIMDPGFWGIAFSLMVISIVPLTYIIVFDLIRQSHDLVVSKFMEWYCAFAFMISSIWLFIESLHLLEKLRDKGQGIF